MEDILKLVIETLLVAVIPVLAALIGKLVVKKIKESDTQVDDYLAGLAVKFAEDYVGKGKGADKLEIAVRKIEELTKGKVDAVRAEALVRSAYQNFYGELKTLKNQ